MDKKFCQITSVEGVDIKIFLDEDGTSIFLPFTHVSPQAALRIAAILAEDPTGVKSESDERSAK